MIKAKNPDGAYWAFGMANDLGNTITTYASVFDAAGNLLPDARVMSDTGFSYAPLREYADLGNGGGNGVPTQVPAPGTALLMALGLLGMGRTRYRFVVSLGRPKRVRAIASISTNIRALLIAYVCLAARGSRTAA
ncbi:PEP-CTERM sorting domain-containing protein [Lamprobacter modestohalophilus]|uniref:PEP-CTERM sorting domain-containing protein n=1 Tax=Lamprobacter modestohalophilus TaxID=1064514 RepID=UPI0019084401|nr:PEP-CTERM sorting domain-containing protein [Lamprobacter modestohalophilus]